MEQKTDVHAQNGEQEVFITRQFDLPVDLVFRAYIEPALVEQWMGTTVLKLESRKHGSYHFETTGPKGTKHGFHGVIHELVPDKKIIRTFEMEGTPYGVQLEVYDFEELDADTCKLTMHVIYESVEKRDQVLQLPFRQGINMAHNRLEQIVSHLK